ncbi:hypothetical protein [Streptomyces sp. MNP-20]|uniref:hypothetical protein n=1 Tax=Streptomyces sp. MNP-20 TaxID=2721165 RepID=UPI001C1E3057|nr:hypothetical protein [Streptomyces sp. MNP-20]
MSHAALALGTALVTAAGCVWYVPALAELRAGADRPVSRRTAAAACVSGWAAAAVTAVLLLLDRTWWAPGAAAATGAVAAAALRVRAALWRRRESREASYHWARLRVGPPPAGRRDSRNVVAVLVGCGLVTAVAVAVIKVAAGPGDASAWLTAALAPAAVLGLFLTVAFAHGRAVHRRAGVGPARPPR